MKKDKSNTRVIIIVLVIILAISVILSGYGLLQNKSNEKSNVQGKNQTETVKRDKGNLDVAESLREDLEIKEIEITNISMNKIKDYYSIEFDMENPTSKEISILLINFVFIDDKGNVLGKIEKEFQPFPPKEKYRTVITTTDEKLFKASKIKLEEVRFTE